MTTFRLHTPTANKIPYKNGYEFTDDEQPAKYYLANHLV